MITRLFLAVTVAVISGCASTPPAPAPDNQPTPVAASFARTWDAVIDIFAQQNIPIKTLDRSSGLIVAEQARVPAYGRFADCGSLFWSAMAAAAGGGDTGDVRADYNVLVRGDSTKSTVRVTARFADAKKECTTKGVFESGIETSVKAGAEPAGRP